MAIMMLIIHDDKRQQELSYLPATRATLRNRNPNVYAEQIDRQIDRQVDRLIDSEDKTDE